jgi:hypothetical protein
LTGCILHRILQAYDRRIDWKLDYEVSYVEQRNVASRWIFLLAGLLVSALSLDSANAQTAAEFKAEIRKEYGANFPNSTQTAIPECVDLLRSIRKQLNAVAQCLVRNQTRATEQQMYAACYPKDEALRVSLVRYWAERTPDCRAGL